MPSPHRIPHLTAILLTATLLSACLRNNGSTPTSATPPPPVVNTMTVTVDSGPAAATGAINHAVCDRARSARPAARRNAPTSITCCSIPVLGACAWSGPCWRRAPSRSAAKPTRRATRSKNARPSAAARPGDRWPWPMSRLAGEVAAKLPVQIMDDTNAGAPPPATCGANGTLLNGVSGFGANGVLGVGVFAQDCGAACVNAATPLPVYYGCTAAGACTAENAGARRSGHEPGGRVCGRQQRPHHRHAELWSMPMATPRCKAN